MNITKQECDKLRQLAEKATAIDTDLYGDRYMQGAWSRADFTYEQDSYYNAANPATILALLDMIDRPAGSHFPERDESKPAEMQGIFHKFEVYRTDGSDHLGGKHYGCRYFVLDLGHDAHAPDAMRAYAASCASTHPELSADIRKQFGDRPAASGDVREELEDPITIPRGLVGAACYLIRKHAPESPLLHKLRAFTIGGAGDASAEHAPVPQFSEDDLTHEFDLDTIVKGIRYADHGRHEGWEKELAEYIRVECNKAVAKANGEQK